MGNPFLKGKHVFNANCIFNIGTTHISEGDSDPEKTKDLSSSTKQGEEKDSSIMPAPVNDNEEKEKPEHKKDKKIKMVTRDKSLLLACSYFDLNHSGYIESKDAEDILLSLMLSLSRAQVCCVVC